MRGCHWLASASSAIPLHPPVEANLSDIATSKGSQGQSTGKPVAPEAHWLAAGVPQKAEGKTTTILSPEGKPITTFEGIISFIKGTGKYKNIQGSGTYKGKLVSSVIIVNEWEGEYFIKK